MNCYTDKDLRDNNCKNNHRLKKTTSGYEPSYVNNGRRDILHRLYIGDHHFLVHEHILPVDVPVKNKHHQGFDLIYTRWNNLQKLMLKRERVDMISWQTI